jgi:thioredoxin 1
MPDCSSSQGTGVHQYERGGIMPLKYKGKSIIVTFLIVIFAGIFFFVSANAQSNTKTPPTVKLPRLVDLGADKCVPCVMMAPELDRLKKEYTGLLEVQFVDVWKYPEEARKYRVRGIPTQIFYNADGKEIHRHLGFISKDDILAKFKALGVMIVKADAKEK